jgi:hypothetical protein
MNDELRAELLERVGRDQAARTSLPPRPTWQQWQEVVLPLDEANTMRMREIIAEHGWPGHVLVGVDGAHAAWLLAQHAPDEFQKECLPLLENAVAEGDASRRDLGYLMDRVLMYRGEPQIYGTQYRTQDGVMKMWPVQDPEDLDNRRAALGLGPQSEYEASILGHE